MKPEELAQWVIDNRYPKGEYNKVSDFEMFHFIVSNVSIPIEPPVILPKANPNGEKNVCANCEYIHTELSTSGEDLHLCQNPRIRLWNLTNCEIPVEKWGCTFFEQREP